MFYENYSKYNKIPVTLTRLFRHSSVTFLAMLCEARMRTGAGEKREVD